MNFLAAVRKTTAEANITAKKQVRTDQNHVEPNKNLYNGDSHTPQNTCKILRVFYDFLRVFYAKLRFTDFTPWESQVLLNDYPVF